jgi:hypothetical protein
MKDIAANKEQEIAQTLKTITQEPASIKLVPTLESEQFTRKRHSASTIGNSVRAQQAYKRNGVQIFSG